MFNNQEKYSRIIKEKAKAFGFLDCGVSKADFLEEEVSALEFFLKNNYHGEMKYMENHFDKRLDPRLLVEGAKSVISLTYNYFPPKNIAIISDFKIAKYAYGEDYHVVIKDILKEMLEELIQEIGDFQFRVFVDSAPVMERAWAKKSGLGWVGKNANLISKKVGSFFFICEIICDLDLKEDQPTSAHCGTCTKCIDACPTDALLGNDVIDASKCISYATIELKNEIPDYFKNKMSDWIFGCDICQDVCPWNRFAEPHQQKRFSANEKWIDYTNEDWKELTQDIFSEIFKYSPIKRAKFTGLKRNIDFLDENKI